MLRKILPVILALIGLIAGGAAGYFLRPAPQPAETAAEAGAPEAPEHAPAEHATGDDAHGAAKGNAAAHGDDHETATSEYVKLNNQFVVPVIEKGQVISLVVLSLSLEVTVGSTEKVYAAEPKIRDALLQVLFDHANAGGFAGAFTDTAVMADLRRGLLETVRTILGEAAMGVLVSDIVRQDTQ